MKIEDIQQATILSIDAIDEAIGYLNGLTETEPNQNAEQLNILERLYFAQVHLTNARQGLPLSFLRDQNPADTWTRDLQRTALLLKLAAALLDNLKDPSPYSQSAQQLQASSVQASVQACIEQLTIMADGRLVK